MSYFDTEYAVTNIHVMVDLETMGVRPGAPIISIGAVLFDPNTQDTVQALRSRGFFRRIDVEDAATHSNGVEPATLKWWLTQEDAAIKALVGADAVGLREALKEFRQYCVDRFARGADLFFADHPRFPKACAIWAKGPDFDCKMLEAACARVDERMPISFQHYRDVRTAQNMAWPDPEDRPKFDVGTAHNALDDAIEQAMTVQAAYKELGLSPETAKLSTF
jgi:exodeoxyribonuclease VIII